MNMDRYIKLKDELNDLGYDVVTIFENGSFNITIKETNFKISGILTINGVDMILTQQLNKMKRLKKLNNIIDENISDNSQ